MFSLFLYCGALAISIGTASSMLSDDGLVGSWRKDEDGRETRSRRAVDLRNTGELDLDNTSERTCFFESLLSPVRHWTSCINKDSICLICRQNVD